MGKCQTFKWQNVFNKNWHNQNVLKGLLHTRNSYILPKVSNGLLVLVHSYVAKISTTLFTCLLLQVSLYAVFQGRPLSGLLLGPTLYRSALTDPPHAGVLSEREFAARGNVQRHSVCVMWCSLLMTRDSCCFYVFTVCVFVCNGMGGTISMGRCLMPATIDNFF